jgi:hypothetical protein
MECHGLIRLRKRQFAQAIEDLERAVGMFPHSRAYLELALALEQRAMQDPAAHADDVSRALRLLEHGVSVGPTDTATGEFQRAMERLSAQSNGAALAR